MSSLRWTAAKGNAYRWVQHADERYVAARFLYWKGFHWDFGLLGAHAIELYLKAYLIHKTGKYPRGHELDRIYQECMQYDCFFKDKSLCIHFLPIKPPLPHKEATWTHYSHVLRYPEALPGQRRPQGCGMIVGVGGTHETLDRIASFVREAVPRPEGHVDVIKELINGEGWIGATQARNNLPEIRTLFLYDNECFRGE